MKTRNMIATSKRQVWIRLVLASCSFLAAVTFDPDNLKAFEVHRHQQMTVQLLQEDFPYLPDRVSVLLSLTVMEPDLMGYWLGYCDPDESAIPCRSTLRPDDPLVATLARMHCDSNKIEGPNGGKRFIEDSIDFSIGHLGAWFQDPTSPSALRGAVEGLVQVGRALHALQDFYAHSNYVESQSLQGPYPADQVPLWNGIDAIDSTPIFNREGTIDLDGLQSGFYDAFYDPKLNATHAMLNKDGPGSAEGEVYFLSGGGYEFSMYQIASGQFGLTVPIASIAPYGAGLAPRHSDRAIRAFLNPGVSVFDYPSALRQAQTSPSSASVLDMLNALNSNPYFQEIVDEIVRLYGQYDFQDPNSFPGDEFDSISGLPKVFLSTGYQIAPDTILTTRGLRGGPFTPTCQSFVISSSDDHPMPWTLSCDVPWVTLGMVAGTLHPSEADTIVVCVNDLANALPVGPHDATLTFDDGLHETTSVRTIRLLVDECAPSLDLANAGALSGLMSSLVKSTSFLHVRNGADSRCARLEVSLADSVAGILPVIESVGDQSKQNYGNLRYRGNVYKADRQTVLRRVRSFLNFSGTRVLDFVVLSGSSEFGPFSIVSKRTVEQTGSGAAFYDSGPLDAPFEPGEFYVVAVGWSGGNITYPFESTPNPVPLSFGSEVYGFAFDNFPLPSTVSSPSLLISSLYQRLTTEDTWLTVNPTLGSIAPGDSLTVAITTDARALSLGHHTGTITIASSDPSHTTVDVPLDLTVVPEDKLGVNPSASFVASGPPGGPFAPTCKQYTLQNAGSSPIAWHGSSPASWISFAPTSGNIAPGGAQVVNVCIAQPANLLAVGAHSADAIFTNETSSTTQKRTVQLTVLDCRDDDQDGYSTCAGDCDDNNPAVHPGAVEICGNHYDDDCDGIVDCPDKYFDDFTTLDQCVYDVYGNLTAWSVRAEGGQLRISKPSGGSTSLNGGFVSPKIQMVGDFDLRVAYQIRAMGRGDQAQLNIVGGSTFDMRREDMGEPVGPDYSVWIGSTCGATGTSDTRGYMRVTRTGTTLRGYKRSPNGPWVELCNRTTITGPLGVELSAQNNTSNPAFDVGYDSLTVSAGSINWLIDNSDPDHDGILTECDNCPNVANPTQADADVDGAGAACDCDDSNPLVRPGRPDICDGVDNDCNGAVDDVADCGLPCDSLYSEVFTTEVPAPSGIAFAHGATYGDFMYVLSHNKQIYRVDAAGHATLWGGIRPDPRAIGLTLFFDETARKTYGGYLYCAIDNSGGSGAISGGVDRILPDGTFQHFVDGQSGSPLLIGVSSGLIDDVGRHGGQMILPDFEADENSSASSTLFKINRAGGRSTFGPLLRGAMDLDLDRHGTFSGDLLVINPKIPSVDPWWNGADNVVYRVRPDGTSSQLFPPSAHGYPTGVIVDEVGTMNGNALVRYSDGTLLRYGSNGIANWQLALPGAGEFTQDRWGGFGHHVYYSVAGDNTIRRIRCSPFTATVAGHVTANCPAPNSPAPGLTVRLLAQGQVVGETSTDSNGDYYFRGLDSGAYLVSLVLSPAYLSLNTQAQVSAVVRQTVRADFAVECNPDLTCKCVGNLVDDFEGGVLAPRWAANGLPCGSIAETGGKLVLNRGQCVGTVGVVMQKAVEVVCGDFDISVEFALSDFTIPASGSRYGSFGVESTDNSQYAVIERYNRFATEPCTPGTQNYKMFVNNSNNCASTMVATGEQTGKFRLRRVGSTIEFYTWTDIWILRATKTFTTADVYIFGYAGTDQSNTPFSIAFDNLSIQSAKCGGLVSVLCPGDMSIKDENTPLLLPLNGFTIRNTSDLLSLSFAYDVRSVGVATLSDGGNPASLSGITPILHPGESYQPPFASLAFPRLIHDGDQQVSYSVTAVQSDDVADGCVANVHYMQMPDAVLFGGIHAVADERGVMLTWKVEADEPIAGFDVYRRQGAGSLAQRVNSETLAPDARTLRDVNVEGGRSYEYYVQAVLPGGQTIRSIASSVKTKPLSLALFQNQPNPFNPTTKISFVLPTRMEARLTVYDVQGRLVRKLADEMMPAGFGEVTWDGRDEKGGLVASGVYFCQLRAGKKELTRKMVMLK